MQAPLPCRVISALLMLGTLLSPRPSPAAEAPPWMRAQLGVALPAHDDKTNAVVLFDETILTVQPNGHIRRMEREAIKILRPDGAARGTARFYSNPEKSIVGIRAWCIPVAGKDYEVKEKEAVESAIVDVAGGELITDLRVKTLRIPESTVGSVIGYEVEYDLRPTFLTDDWDFQDDIPVREAHYSLHLPPGWSYEARWLNHADQAPATTAPNQWSWSVEDVPAVRIEKYMPPWQGIAARMVVALISPGGKSSGIKSWDQIGAWYSDLTAGRHDASPAIKQKVVELTAAAASPLEKMQALASFAQNDVRYVAIELGIGGHQPHPAADVFSHRYGDCKDKTTLLMSMLKEIGIESYYVIINTERGAVSASTPPNLDFNHAIIAIALPANMESAKLQARITHPQLGQLLFFDPTDPLTPLGSLSGPLQANYAMLVSKSGGELVELPQLPADSNGVVRTARMSLDEKGTLNGEVLEIRSGDSGAAQRYALRTATVDTDKIKSVESLAGSSLANFTILKAAVRNLQAADRPFEWHYSLEAQGYAKFAGDLLLVRPRVLGSEASGFLETKEARRHPIEFTGPVHDADTYEISLPPGYAIDELPPPVDVDDGFASYHSKSEYIGGALRYSRTFEIKELSVPASKAEQLKELFRIIENDERNSAVLKRVSK